MIKINKKGFAIPIVLVSLLFLVTIGIAFVFWVLTVSKQTTQKKLTTGDIYNSELGAEQAIERLKRDNVFAAPFVDDNPGSISSYTYTLDGSTIQITIQDEF